MISARALVGNFKTVAVSAIFILPKLSMDRARRRQHRLVKSLTLDDTD
jgi:hypothetical protein